MTVEDFLKQENFKKQKRYMLECLSETKKVLKIEIESSVQDEELKRAQELCGKLCNLKEDIEAIRDTHDFKEFNNYEITCKFRLVSARFE